TDGWSSRDIATPNSKAKGLAPGNPPEYQFFTPDLATALDEPFGTGAEPPLASGVTQATPYLRDNSSGTFLPLLTEENTASGAEYGSGVDFLTATPDLKHALLSSRTALLGAGSSPGLYEWTGGSLQFVSVLPSGAPYPEPELGFQGRVLSN